MTLAQRRTILNNQVPTPKIPTIDLANTLIL